ncbi:hypothetical protein M885DRAFT_574620 [Pelagophyceae sp. CCMP2097]|nr:hypothetical protein M885DRAFT_574620 [Pelagophyceae sp. CCMP2097]
MAGSWNASDDEGDFGLTGGRDGGGVGSFDGGGGALGVRGARLKRVDTSRWISDVDVGKLHSEREGESESDEDAGESFQNNIVRGASIPKTKAKKDAVKVQIRLGLKQISATLLQIATVASLDLQTVLVVGVGLRGNSLIGKIPGAVVEARGATVVRPINTKNGIVYVVSIGPKVSAGSRGVPAAQGAQGEPTAHKPASAGVLAAAAAKRSAAQREKTPATSSMRQPQAQPAVRRGASSAAPIVVEADAVDDADDEDERGSKSVVATAFKKPKLSRRDQKVERLDALAAYGKEVGLAQEVMKLNRLLLVEEGNAPKAVQGLFVLLDGELILDERKFEDAAVVLALTQVAWDKYFAGGLSKYTDLQGDGVQGSDGRLANFAEAMGETIAAALTRAAPGAVPGAVPVAAPAAATLPASATDPPRTKPRRLSELADGADVTDLAQDLPARIHKADGGGRSLAAVLEPTGIFAALDPPPCDGHPASPILADNAVTWCPKSVLASKVENEAWAHNHFTRKVL